MTRGGPIRYYGGKARAAARLLPLLPATRIYVEPFAGAASILFAREPSPVEVLNDLDGDIATLMRALRDPIGARELRAMLVATPYSREAFTRALAIRADPQASMLDRAWAVFVAQNQAFGAAPRSPGNWGRGLGGARDLGGWRSRLEALERWHLRLARVQIDTLDALACIRYWDTEETLFYVDPPFLAETRTSNDDYAREMSLEQHRELHQALLAARGAVALSGYRHEIHQMLEEAGWERTDFRAVSHAAGGGRATRRTAAGGITRPRRVESLWRNPRCLELCAAQARTEETR